MSEVRWVNFNNKGLFVGKLCLYIRCDWGMMRDDNTRQPTRAPPITWSYHSVPINPSVWCHRSDTDLWWHHLHRSITAAASVFVLVHMRSPSIAVANSSMHSHALRILGRVMDLKAIGGGGGGAMGWNKGGPKPETKRRQYLYIVHAVWMSFYLLHVFYFTF